MSGNNYNLHFCSHFISLLRSLSLWIADIVYVYFVYFVTSTVLLLLSQTKGHTHTTQVKAPCTQTVLLCGASECSPFLLKDASLFPCPPHPLPHEGCMVLLPYMDLNVGSWCKVYTTPFSPFRASDKCTLRGETEFWDTVVSPLLCIHLWTASKSRPATHKRTLPNCTRSSSWWDVTKPYTICQSWNTLHTLILTIFVSLFLKLCVNCCFFYFVH